MVKGFSTGYKWSLVKSGQINSWHMQINVIPSGVVMCFTVRGEQVFIVNGK